jgi:uncharacterized phage-associated protein
VTLLPLAQVSEFAHSRNPAEHAIAIPFASLKNAIRNNTLGYGMQLHATLLRVAPDPRPSPFGGLKMAYSPAVIANYFLAKASSEERALTPMQLLKLVFIAHGFHLAYYRRPLIDETVQAWRYGPVIHSLYNQLRHHGGGGVSKPIQTGVFPWECDSEVAPSVGQLLDEVWKGYRKYSGTELSAITHVVGSPWYKAWHDNGGKNVYFAEIDDESIADYYSRKLASVASA